MQLTDRQRRLADEQGGLLSDVQARGLLGGAAVVRQLVALGVLHRVAPRVVALPGTSAPRDALRVASLGLAGAVVSGPSAAVVHGLDLPEPPLLIHLTVPRNSSRGTRSGLRVTRRDLLPGDVVSVDGLPVLGPLPTLIDIARRSSLTEAVVAADCALRHGVVGSVDIADACRAARGNGATRVQALPGLIDPRAMSALESLCRLLLVLAGLPAPVTQLEVRDEDGTLVGMVDFGWPEARLLLETDGFAWHRERADYRKDRERANAYARLGGTLLRVT